MARPNRCEIVENDEVAVLHVFSRCVRRAFCCGGGDPLTGACYQQTPGLAPNKRLFNDGIDFIATRWRPGEGTAYYLTDHLGTVREIIDAGGNVINEITYDSFGRILSQTDPLAGDRFTSTGREWDPALGFYYYRARFYAPTTGRFIRRRKET